MLHKPEKKQNIASIETCIFALEVTLVASTASILLKTCKSSDESLHWLISCWKKWCLRVKLRANLLTSSKEVETSKSLVGTKLSPLERIDVCADERVWPERFITGKSSLPVSGPSWDNDLRRCLRSALFPCFLNGVSEYAGVLWKASCTFYL